MPDDQSPLAAAVSPKDVVRLLADKGIAISERALRAKARRLSAFRDVGREMFFLPEDLERIIAPPAEAGSSIAPKVSLSRLAGRPKAPASKPAPKAVASLPRKPSSPPDPPSYPPMPMRNPKGKSLPKH